MDCCTVRGRPITDRPHPNQMTTHKQSLAVEKSDEEILHRTRAGRALRNRKYRRLVEDQRQNKRLFTPEIKRFLKSWLVRRRKNPYPNRSEKKDLALKTGLTYVQVCNWFANWRRKLKKSSRERHRCTWGNLIKDYNTKAQGNVEQFSISSDDSIWEEAAVNANDLSDVDQLTDSNPDSSNVDHCYFSVHNCQKPEPNHKFTTTLQPQPSTYNELDRNGNRLNRKFMRASFLSDGAEVYNRRKEDEGEDLMKKSRGKKTDPPLLLSKWLESAAKFVPRDSFIAWSTNGQCRAGSWQDAAKRTRTKDRPGPGGRHRKELDAAEALTSLSRQSWLTTTAS